MREIHIHRAEGTAADGVVEPVIIRIERDQPVPAYGDPDYVQRCAEMFQADGTALAEAILGTCPGGTIDATIAALLAKRASLFRVRFPQEANRPMTSVPRHPFEPAKRADPNGGLALVNDPRCGFLHRIDDASGVFCMALADNPIHPSSEEDATK